MAFSRMRTADIEVGDRILLATKAQRHRDVSEYREVAETFTKRTPGGGSDRVVRFTDGTCVVFNPAAKCWRLTRGVEVETPARDKLGNTIAREGADRCWCGCKYWEYDRCIDCGTHVTSSDVERSGS